VTSLRHYVATSPERPARLARSLYRGLRGASLPLPRAAAKPLLWGYLGARNAWWFLRRVLIAEPLFKAMCTRHGRDVHTGIFIHFIQGKGELIVGDGVTVSGKIGIAFASRFSARPTLEIGDHTVIGHSCSFTVARRITVGRHCLLAAEVRVADSNGHSTDPASRLAGLPPRPEEIRPVTIEDNVWIGTRAMIFPGVTIGEGSVVAAGSLVRRDVEPYTVVAGNPAVKVKDLERPDDGRAAS
jgi:acetyltransferase-like isoleucine patch superfamily enzyme